MKKLLTCGLIMLSIYSNAQGLKAKKAARYDTRVAKDSSVMKHGGMVYIYLDQSEKVKFYGGLCLPEFAFATANPFSLTTGLDMDFFLKKISLHGVYRFGLIDYMHMMSNNINETNWSENTIGRLQVFEAGGSFFLSDKHIRKKHKIVLERHGSSRSSVEYYILPELPCRELLAIRGGFWGYNSGVNTNQNTYNKVDGAGAVKADDGTVLSKNYYTTASVRGGYIGISKTTLFSCVTKNSFKRGAVYANKDISQMYADLLIGNTVFDPIIDSSGPHIITANRGGSFQTLPVGARVGYSSTAWGGKVGTKFELGYRPGLKDKGLYFTWSNSFSLSHKVRK